jgi:PAS domain S-box-containing protein
MAAVPRSDGPAAWLDPRTLDALGCWVIVLDRQGRVAHVNPALVEASGLEGESWAGRPVWEVFSLGEDATAVQRILSDRERRHFPNSYESAFRTADGRVLRARWMNTALFDEGGELAAIIGAGTEVGVESELPELLLESESRFSALARNASELIAEVDDEGRFVFLSPNHEAIMGYTAEQLLGRLALELVHPDDMERGLALEATLRSEGAFAHEPLRYRRADGSWRWLELSATVYLSRVGAPRGIFVSRDVTERHQSEEARTAFGRVLEESLNEIYVFDAASLRFLQANRGARENLGYSMEELRERTPLELNPELSAEDFAELLAPLRSGEVARVGFETVHQRKDGSRYPVEVHLQQVTLDGAPVIVAFVVDLTEKVRTAEELAETDRRAREAERLASIGMLAAGLAHDIGTPMNVILGYAEMLGDSLSEERDRERVRIISEQVRRVTDLVRVLMNLARPHEASREPVALAKLLEDSLAFYREKLRARAIDVRRSFEEAPDVLADEGRLQQVFLNLLVNAADAMPTGGSLDVSLARCGDDRVEVRIRDTGGGIPEDLQARLFEPFFTTKVEGRGTGLGLLVSKGIVVDHGGTIDVASEVGKGTEFRIVLPLTGRA